MSDDTSTTRGQWRADFNDLTGEETDRALRMLGISYAEVEHRMVSVACATAVILAQRSDPSLPDDTWKRLKMRDLDMGAPTEDQGEPEGEGCPTIPGC